jgi:cephalosporin-C deacetylase-like acetyl esterase
MEHQISMFDTEPLTEFQEALLHGSGFEGGKHRIYSAALQLPFKNFSSFLKKEYGIGGFSFKDGFVDYGSSGICMWKFRSDKRSDYSWNEVAKAIKQLIATDMYLNEKDKNIIAKQGLCVIKE